MVYYTHKRFLNGERPVENNIFILKMVNEKSRIGTL